MYSNVILSTTLLVLVIPYNYKIVEASPFTREYSPSTIQDSTLKPIATMSSQPLSSTTSFSTSTQIASTYWTAFINISYVHYANNSSRPVFHTDRTETGRYGTASNRDVRGVAVEMISKESKLRGENISLENESQNDEDITGCFPPFLDNYPLNEPWIAVVKRGQCTFNEKVKHALELNASGVLVYDAENGKKLVSMKGKAK